MSFQYFQPTLPKDKKTTGSSGVDLTHVDQNIVPIQHDTYCLGLEGTGNNSNQWNGLLDRERCKI